MGASGRESVRDVLESDFFNDALGVRVNPDEVRRMRVPIRERKPIRAPNGEAGGVAGGVDIVVADDRVDDENRDKAIPVSGYQSGRGYEGKARRLSRGMPMLMYELKFMNYAHDEQ